MKKFTPSPFQRGLRSDSDPAVIREDGQRAALIAWVSNDVRFRYTPA